MRWIFVGNAVNFAVNFCKKGVEMRWNFFFHSIHRNHSISCKNHSIHRISYKNSPKNLYPGCYLEVFCSASVRIPCAASLTPIKRQTIVKAVTGIGFILLKQTTAEGNLNIYSDWHPPLPRVVNGKSLLHVRCFFK